MPLTVAAAYLATGKSGFFGEEKARYEANVEAWVCAACGYTELYSRVDVLAFMVESDHPGVRLIDGTSEARPYR